MTKEEFLLLMKFNNQAVTELKTSKDRLTQEFIEANKEFCIGEKVVVIPYNTTRKEIGIVYKIAVNDQTGRIQYKVKKTKKNGTESQHELHIWFDDTIQKFES